MPNHSSKAKFAYYAAYHDKKERWSDGKDPAAFIKTGLDAAGMSQADFDAALQDPTVQQTLEKWKAAYDVAKIQGVPAYVVNGKYLIYTRVSNPLTPWLSLSESWQQNKQGRGYGFHKRIVAGLTYHAG